MSASRFKHTSRPIRSWPPHVDGYVHLFNVFHATNETAYYCTTAEAAALSALLGPHMEQVEDMLRSGKTLEQVVEHFGKQG